MHIGRRLARPLARTSLLVRYGVISGLLVLCLALALGYVLASTVYDRALAQSEQTAANIAQLAVGPLLQRDDFDQGAVAPERRERLTGAMETLVAHRTVVRVKIFDRTGTVLFADDPDLIGQRFPEDPHLQAALGGQRSSDLDEPDSAENASEASLGGRLLEVYVPIRKSTAAGADATSSVPSRSTCRTSRWPAAPQPTPSACCSGSQAGWSSCGRSSSSLSPLRRGGCVSTPANRRSGHSTTRSPGCPTASCSPTGPTRRCWSRGAVAPARRC
ncbi:MAG: hypothetical protein M3474_01840 [Actinomycetota bacterium]|nr:hypothetical protein [Actinomycetota bacterium]